MLHTILSVGVGVLFATFAWLALSLWRDMHAPASTTTDERLYAAERGAVVVIRWDGAHPRDVYVPESYGPMGFNERRN